MPPEQFFYGPYGEMQRLTLPTRVGYAGSGEKKRMQGDGNNERQTTQEQEQARSVKFEQYLRGIFNDLKSIGQIDRRYHNSFELWQSAPENRGEVARYVADFNREWAMGRISGGVGQIPLEQQLTPEQLAAFQEQLRQQGGEQDPNRPRAQRRGNQQSENAKDLIKEITQGEGYVGDQLEYSRRLQSFESVELMFFALAAYSRDPGLWFPVMTELTEEQKRKNPPGEFPLVTVGPKNEQTGEYEITLNEKNIMRFVRHYINYYNGESPYGNVDFFGKMAFEAGGRTVSLYNETVTRRDTMFRTTKIFDANNSDENKRLQKEENEKLGRLADNIAKEIFAMHVIRNHGLEISRQRRNLSGSEYVKLISQAFTENRLTDPYWGQDPSMIAFLSTLSQNFSTEVWKDPEGDDKGVERRESDNKMGFAFLGMVETIMLLSDREGMLEAFPEAKDTILNFAKLKEAIEEDAKGRGEDPTVVIQELRANNIDHFREAEENPESHHYMSVINIFNNPQKDQHIDRAVRKLIQQTIGEQYGLTIRVKDKDSDDPNATKEVLDEENLRYVFLYAEHFSHLTGITSMLDTEMKFPSSDVFNSLKAHLRDLRKMGYSGPATTWNTFNMTGIPLFWAAKTSSGKSLAEIFVELRKEAKKTTEEVKKAEKIPDEQTKKDNIAKAQHAYQKETAKLTSGLNQQSRYVDKFLTHAVSLQEMMASGKMIHWQEYTEYDPIEKQYVLKEFEFGQQVQNEILKKIYEMYLTYEHIDFKQPYRMQQMVEVDDDSEAHGGDHGGHGHGPKKKQIPYVVEVPLAVAMFGREVLDIQSFWKTDEHGRPVLNMMGEREIDVDKINNTEGRVELAKSVFLNIVAGQVFAHRQKYSLEHKYGSKFYRSVITSLKSIHEQQFRDPDNLQNLRFVGHAFHRHHIKWLRQKARITEMQLWRMDMWRDIKRKGRWGEAHKGVTSHVFNAARKDAA